eukprot:955828_1
MEMLEVMIIYISIVKTICDELIINKASFTSNRNNFKNGPHGTLGIEHLINADTFDGNIIKSLTRTKNNIFINMGLCNHNTATATSSNARYIINQLIKFTCNSNSKGTNWLIQK